MDKIKKKNIVYALLPLIILNIVLAVNFVWTGQAEMAEGQGCYSTDRKLSMPEAYTFKEEVFYNLGESCDVNKDGGTIFEYYGNNTNCWDQASEELKKECEFKYPYGNKGTMITGGNMVLSSAYGIYFNGYDSANFHWLMSTTTEPHGNAIGMATPTASILYGNNAIVNDDLHLATFTEDDETYYPKIQFAPGEEGPTEKTHSIELAEEEVWTADGVLEPSLDIFYDAEELKVIANNQGECGECDGFCSDGLAGDNYKFLPGNTAQGVKVANTIRADSEIRECGDTFECEEACCRKSENDEQDMYYVADELSREPEEYIDFDCPNDAAGEMCDIDAEDWQSCYDLDYWPYRAECKFCSPQPYPKWWIEDGIAIPWPPGPPPYLVPTSTAALENFYKAPEESE